MKKYLLPIIIIVGLFLRLYGAREWFLYSHDQDLLGWIIRDIVEDGHLRLIGQETSQHGVFIGPLFYYSVIPFYLLFNWDPIGGVFWVAALGAFAIWSAWFVFKRVVNETAGLVAALTYAVSYSIVLSDREVVPTMPVMLWSIWFLYCLHLLALGKQKTGWLLVGLLMGLVWHFNMGLVLLSPLLILAFLLSKKKIELRRLVVGGVVGFILLLPFIVFELRHNFIQINAIFSSGTETSISVSLSDKFDRVIQLMGKNVYRIFFAERVEISHLLTLVLALTILKVTTVKKLFGKGMGILLWLWVGIFILFFSFNPIVVSEYYLNAVNVVWLAAFAAGVTLIAKRSRLVAMAIVSLFVIFNMMRFTTHAVNESGYLERRGIIQEIKKDAARMGYPCVSISYITSPGNDLGYRYFTWLEKLKTAPISERTPVYTIVFPHSLVDKIDKSVGALGLIYPDYKSYKMETIEDSCQEEDYNLTYPVFGYTE